VQRALKRGTITRNRWGKIDAAKADKDWARNTNPAKSHPKARAAVQSGGNGNNGQGSYSEHRARIAAIDAEIKQLDLDERRRRVVPVDLAGAQQFRFFRALRNRMLMVAGRVAPDLLGCKDMREIERVIQAEVRGGLDELAETEGIPKA
jgi:hypothetical protein